MEFMEILRLIGVVIVIAGFALKLEPILIIFAALIVTGLVGGLGIEGLIYTLGSSFVANRVMAIFIIIFLAIGTLERNGLREAAAKLISKIKGSTPGSVIAAYGPIRGVFGAFNVSFGGVAGLVRPMVMPMAEGAIIAKGHKPDEEHMEKLKGMAAGMENIAWFMAQVVFVGGAGGLLVQTTLAGLGIEVELLDLAIASIPVAIVSILLAGVVYYIRDRKMMKKYYGKDTAGSKKEEEE
jgi:uncharacterized membrane protein